MNKLRLLVLVNVVVALCAVTAFAGDNGKPGSTPGSNTKAISWDELKARCTNPLQFDQQLAPQNIVVQCTDQFNTWIAAQPGEVPLPGHRTVIAAAFADKVHVEPMQGDIPVYTKSGSCQRFKEVQYTLTVEHPVSCGDVEKADSLVEFCAQLVDVTKGANPKLVDEHDTGRVIDNCGGGDQQSIPGKGGK